MTKVEAVDISVLHCSDTQMVYSKQCVDVCPLPTYYHDSYNECLDLCTALSVWEGGMLECVTTCPYGTAA